MPTFAVQIDEPAFRRGRSLRVPAVDADHARRRGARRALALNFPEVGRYLTGPEFRDCAEPVVGRCSAVEVGR